MIHESLKNNYAYALLILANMIWGGNFVIGRIAVDYFPPVTFSLLRWTIAFVVLTPFMMGRLKKDWRTLWNYRWVLCLLTLTGIAGYNTIVYLALHFTTSINAAVVNSTTPLFIAIFSIFLLRERLTPIQIGAISLSIIGVIFILSKGSIHALQTLSFNIGDLFVLVAVVCWSLYSIIIKKYATILPILTTLYVTAFLGVLSLIPLSLLEMSQTDIPVSFNGPSVSILVYVGIFASIMAFLSWNTGVRKVGPAKAGIFLNLLPVFATVFSILFTDETLLWYQAVGGCIVISAVLLSSKAGAQSKQQNVDHSALSYSKNG